MAFAIYKNYKKHNLLVLNAEKYFTVKQDTTTFYIFPSDIHLLVLNTLIIIYSIHYKNMANRIIMYCGVYNTHIWPDVISIYSVHYKNMASCDNYLPYLYYCTRIWPHLIIIYSVHYRNMHGLM